MACKMYKIVRKVQNEKNLRDIVYDIVLKEFNTLKEKFYSKLNEDFFRGISEFLKKSLNSWLKVQNKVDSSQIMPIGVMILGANTPDHNKTVSSLCDVLTKKSNNYIVRLKSRDCGSLKKIMEQIVKSIIPPKDLVELKIPISIRHSLIALDEWLKDRRSMEQIIIILEDVELFNCELLQNFIEIISIRNSEHPFVILMGVASNLESFNGMLNNQCLLRVNKHYFPSSSPSEILNGFLIFLMDQQFPFQLTSRLYSYIVNEMFMSIDYSISNLLYRYQFCLHEHIYNFPNLESILNLKVDNYAEFCSLNQQIISVRNNQKLFVQIANWLLDLFSTFNDTKLGTKFHQVLMVHLKYGLANSEHLKSNLELLKTTGYKKVIELVKLANSKLVIEKENNSVICDFIGNSIKFASELPENDMFSENETLVMPTNRKDLKSQIFKNARVDRKKPYLENFCNWLNNWLLEHLPHYSTIRNYEALYIDNLETFKRNINPSIRETLKKGLINPYLFIKNEQLRLNSLESINMLPDTCIAFKLHLEYPKSINLYDWLQAFAQIIEKNNSGDSLPSLMTQCRFNRAVTELEFLGYVQRAKSKVDHMNKLTWGALF